MLQRPAGEDGDATADEDAEDDDEASAGPPLPRPLWGALQLTCSCCAGLQGEAPLYGDECKPVHYIVRIKELYCDHFGDKWMSVHYFYTPVRRPAGISAPCLCALHPCPLHPRPAHALAPCPHSLATLPAPPQI
jgi:hypothetical protein